MPNKKRFITFVIIMSMMVFFGAPINVSAATDDDLEPAGDEQDTFIAVSPDALIILDLSGSMDWGPTGGYNYAHSTSCASSTHCTGTDCADGYCSSPIDNCSVECPFKYGSSSSCAADFTNCAGEGCKEGYCNYSRTGCAVDCRRVEIAKRALFNVLDDDNNNVIDTQDANSLNVRIGYMRFTGGDDTSGNYDKGAIKLVTKISTLGSKTGTSYQLTYCGAGTTGSCSPTSTCGYGTECIGKATASGGTPLVSALKEAKKYLDDHKASDPAKTCRQKFVLLLSDGADTYACNNCNCNYSGCEEGCGGECQKNMYKRRREVVAAAKQLRDAGYKVFVVGFGAGMPDYLKNTLNWMAYYGGTDNVTENNTDPSAYSIITTGCTPNATPPVTTSCCNLSTNPTACFPTGITSCQEDTGATASAMCQNIDTPNFKATANDPGYLPLSGYAFITGDANQLTTALKSAFSTIRTAAYSFTQASIQAVRTADENFIYEASFQPLDYEPFWVGHLKRYSIDGTTGQVNAGADWDAGAVLAVKSAGDRNIWTYAHGSLREFVSCTDSGCLTAADLGVTTDTEKNTIINYFRGGETNSNVTAWKLGDIYHSSPMSIATPNPLFYDKWDIKTPTKAFADYRTSHERKSSTGTRIFLIGANDGQLHAIRAGENALTGGTGGDEIWSFIPPNMLPKLKSIYHTAHPSTLEHQYFVDGPTAAADIWLGPGSNCSDHATCQKASGEWYTYAVMSEGRGGITTLWSSHASCDENFSPTYSSTYAHYCGYYALDVTNPLQTPWKPVFKWKLGGPYVLSATDGPHFGQAWSKMYIGRVQINNAEKWVGLIGGGYSRTDCKGGGTCDPRGKGFYVVDLSDGTILWRYTHSGPSGVTNADMDFNLAAAPVAVDFDNDGFLDTAYIGDLAGNVWRFKFCSATDGNSCSNTSACDTDGNNCWSGGKLFDTPSGEIRPIYNPVAVSIDTSYKLWVYFGTGDITDPTAPNAQERFYAIQDADRKTTYTPSNLQNIGQTGTYTDLSKIGWYIPISGSGEKILAEPIVFEGRVYFTSYVPASGTDLCNQGGQAKLFIVDYLTGAGKLELGAKSKVIGTGIATAPIISRSPSGTTDLYVSLSHSSAIKVGDPNVSNNPANSMIYWHDLRVQ